MKSSLKERLTSLKAGETGGVGVLRRRDTSRLAEGAVRFIISFILAGSQILSDMSPFAVGFTAAAGTPVGAMASLAGALTGYLLTSSFVWALKYISMCVIVCTATLIFHETEIFSKRWFMPVFTSFVAMCLGSVAAFDAGWTIPAVVRFAADVVLTGGCAYFYKIALSPWSGRFNLEHSAEIVHTVSVLILISTMLISLAQYHIAGVISVGRALAVLVVLLAGYKGGVSMGCATGVAVGLAMDAATSQSPIFCMAYGLAALVAGIFSKQGRLIYSVMFILLNACVAGVSLESPAVPGMLYETFIATVLFMLLPPSLMSRLGVLIPGTGSGYGIIKAREYTRARVELAAQAFRELYETVGAASGKGRRDSDIAAVFDGAADVVCLSCSKQAKCWHIDYQDTLDAMNNATKPMLARGKLEEEDLPDYFKKTCLNLGEFVAAVNAELRGVLYRRQYKKRLKENQAAAFNQYAEVASILQGIADELGTGVSVEPELEGRLRKFLKGVNIPGETAVFIDKSGRLHGEIFGTSVRALKSVPNYLEKLSEVLRVRICAVEKPEEPDRLYLLEAEPLAASVGISFKKKHQEEVSGDKGAYFKTDDGILYVILSDGMGSGELAARYSGETVRILERFLRSGVEPETAVRMLNDLMLLKNQDDTGCATVDLVCINLFTGQTKMFKYGAAPSYLRTGTTVRRVKGRSLAAGLGVPPHDAPDRHTMDLRPGNMAVIVSDGVTGGADDNWIVKMIAEDNGEDPRLLAAAIVEQATSRFGSDDDMTVIVIQIKERG
jgi:stage II sporulation protein E